jgi:hypothetical protein
MSIVSILSAVLAGSSLLLAAGGQKSLADFEANLRQYMEIRKEAAKSVPGVKKKADPAAVIAREQALAAAIRKARPAARPGDIITPAAQKHFRSITMEEIRAPDGAPVKQTIKQGNPPADQEGADVKLQINGKYPKSAPKSTMPPSLLARFPKLPEELQYRFVGRTLILLDVAANLIVDYAPEVGPSL